VSGPAVREVIATAPTSALAAIAAELGLDPAAVSPVIPAVRVTHDITNALQSLAVARAADAAGQVSCDRAHRSAAALDYALQRGYEPLHPLPARVVEPRPLLELRQDYAEIEQHSVSGDIGGGFPLTEAELDAVEAEQHRRRQEIADLFVAEAQLERSAAAEEQQWMAWAEAEHECAAAAGSAPEPTAPVKTTLKGKQLQRSPEISFRGAGGEELSINPGAAAHIRAAYARLSGRDVGLGFFAAHSDAVLAHGVHIGRCDTAAEAIGEQNWNAYLDRAQGREQDARRAVAADVSAVFACEDAAAYATRGTSAGIQEVTDAAYSTTARWDEDTDTPWSLVSPLTATSYEVLLDGLLQERDVIADEPFGAYDVDLAFSRGGVYGPESVAVEEMAGALRQLRNDPDERVVAVADEIAQQAFAARALPSETLAQRTERQWRLVELSSAATLLSEDRGLMENVTVLAPVHPDQLSLLDLECALT